MLKIWMSFILIVSFTLSGCATIYNPATERQEFIFVTTPVEVSIGKMLQPKIATQFKISNDEQINNRVAKIGEKLANVSDRKDLIYHLKVIEDEDLNAFTTPGGYIYINSGLIKKATDDELACVTGHEIGHIAARHIAKKLQAQIGYDVLLNIASRSSGVAELRKAASISYDLIMLGYSREDEMLADRLGVKYAYKAGYDPFAMITFLEKLKDANGKEMGFVFLRSHPYTSQRIKMLKTGIPAIIEKVDKKTVAAVRVQKEKPLNPAPIVADKDRPLKVMCPVCKKIFSGETRYCPYDGAELQ